MRRTLAWSAVAALVVLGSRTIVYALSPSGLAAELSHRAGGPALPAVTVASAALALVVSVALVSLAASGGWGGLLRGTRPAVALPRPALGRPVARGHTLQRV